MIQMLDNVKTLILFWYSFRMGEKGMRKGENRFSRPKNTDLQVPINILMCTYPAIQAFHFHESDDGT